MFRCASRIRVRPEDVHQFDQSEYAALANLDWSDTHRALQWLLEKRFSNKMKGT